VEIIRAAGGLFKSVELVEGRESRKPATELAARIVSSLRSRRILAGRTGRHENILKLRPPMVFSRENADFFPAGFRFGAGRSLIEREGTT